MAKHIEFERDAACKGIILQSDEPIAYLGHQGDTPLKTLFIPDSTMTVLEGFIKETREKIYCPWAKPGEAIDG